jgi:G3E family GTPase
MPSCTIIRDTCDIRSLAKRACAQSMAAIPITIITGFLGAGKTTLILNLLPQLHRANPSYRLALLKNEFGDLAVDSQLAASSAISGVTELLNGCICCNLVGQLGEALTELARTTSPDRIVVETSGSAFPATLAMEVNRLARDTGGKFVLDGVVSVIDVENWKGYEDTSYTAKLQARYTDVIVLNKWEDAGERRLDEVLDRIGDLGLETPQVKSDKGWVSKDVVFGIDRGLAQELTADLTSVANGHDQKHHDHYDDHQSEVEVISVTLSGPEGSTVNVSKLQTFLETAPKEEIYRIKAVITAAVPPRGSDEICSRPPAAHPSRYILNWAFGRWTFTPVALGAKKHDSSQQKPLRMTIILARYESQKWQKKIQSSSGDLALDEPFPDSLKVTRIS